ncbi:MAG: 30S ribosomal protein S17 [Solirubrobacterales bacterium]|nr:30S ribosomal protein S17 [Solirubrobacterales bacterium]
MAETENNETETPGGAQAPAEDAAPEETTTEAAAPREPAEVVAPKERRRRARVSKAAQTKARAPRTPEERHAERGAERARKAAARRVERTRARDKARAARAGGAEVQTTLPREHGPGRQKTRQGVVVSDKADKTITVRIDIARRHRRYEKIVRTSNTLHAHDEANDAHIGDTVIVRECRPLSRLKRWRLVEVVERAE